MPATAAVGNAAAALLPPLGAVALFEGDIELVLVADRETDAVEVELAVVVPVAVCVAVAVALDDAVLVATGAVRFVDVADAVALEVAVLVALTMLAVDVADFVGVADEVAELVALV
jgi:hypothetical protein